MLKILPCLDSDELADSRRRELNIPHDGASALGRPAVEAADNGYYVNRSGAKVDWSHYVQAACAAKVSIPPELSLPAHTHRAGDPSRLKNKPYPRDQWALDSPLASEEPLDTHLKWLANQLRPHYAYIRSLKSPDTDVYILCGYTTEVEQNDFSLSSEALEIFTTLDISLEFSILAV